MTDTNYKYEVGKWYKTHGGLDAQILDDNFKGQFGETLAGKIKDRSGGEYVRSWHADGRWVKHQESGCDLMPPVETKDIWVNVYPEDLICRYTTKSRSDECASGNRIGLLKITITGDDYTVEKVEI